MHYANAVPLPRLGRCDSQARPRVLRGAEARDRGNQITTRIAGKVTTS